MEFTLSRNQFEKCRRDMANQGVRLDGDSGTISDSGCVVDYRYAEPTLTIDIRKKPFMIPISFLEGKIAEWFSAETQ